MFRPIAIMMKMVIVTAVSTDGNGPNSGTSNMFSW
jgi:hypothetical protein